MHSKHFHGNNINIPQSVAVYAKKRKVYLKMEEKLNEKRECCTCKHIDGIVCDVKNCVHHTGECYCTAKQIVVGPSNAECSGATECATFQPRDDS